MAMTEEQIKKAQNKAKWDAKMAERDRVKKEQEDAKAGFIADGSYTGMLYTKKDGDEVRYYASEAEKQAAANPYKNDAFAGSTGSDSDIWNINNGWERTAKANKNEYTGGDSTLQPAQGFDGTGAYGSDTSGAFNNINRDTLFEYENGLFDAANKAKSDAAIKTAQWGDALNGNPKFGDLLLQWATANPGAEGAGQIILDAQNGVQPAGEGMLGDTPPAASAAQEQEYNYTDVTDLIAKGFTYEVGSKEGMDHSLLMGTRSVVDAYVDGMGTEAETSPIEFFGVINNLFAADPEAFNQWKRDNPVMALRFHAIAGSHTNNVSIFGGTDPEEGYNTC